MGRGLGGFHAPPTRGSIQRRSFRKVHRVKYASLLRSPVTLSTSPSSSTVRNSAWRAIGIQSPGPGDQTTDPFSLRANRPVEIQSSANCFAVARSAASRSEKLNFGTDIEEHL